MRIWVNLIFYGFLGVLSACRTLGGDSDTLRVQPEDKPPRSGESLTASRVLSLNEWARNLLQETRDLDDFQKMADDYFAKNGIKDALPLKTYTINLRPGNECFRESTPGHSLWWARNREQIARQIESAAQFIFVHHKAVLGKPKGPFQIREIEICPKSTSKSDLNFNAGKLIIGVPYNLVQGYRPWTSDQLLSLWRQGAHLDPEDLVVNRWLTRKKLINLWSLFDPIGSFRLNIRQSYDQESQTLSQRLGQLGTSSSLDHWKNLLWGTSVDPRRIRIANDETLRKIWTEQKSGQLLQNYRCLVANPVTADDLSWGSQAVFEKWMGQRSNNIDIKIKAGLVAVGNYHQIGVTLSTYQGAYYEYLNTQVGPTESTVLKAQVEGGLVAVFTVDDIKVDVALNVLKQLIPQSLGTAALDRATLATLDQRNLCL